MSPKPITVIKAADEFFRFMWLINYNWTPPFPNIAKGRNLSKKQNKTSKKFLNAAEFDIWHSRKTSADFAKSRRPLTFITHHSLSWVIQISSFRKRKKLKILSTMNLHEKASFVAFEEIGALIKSFCKTIKVTTWLQSYNKSMHVRSIKKKLTRSTAGNDRTALNIAN